PPHRHPPDAGPGAAPAHACRLDPRPREPDPGAARRGSVAHGAAHHPPVPRGAGGGGVRARVEAARARSGGGAGLGRRGRVKTLQVTTPGKFVIREVPVPEPGPGEVLLKIEAGTPCPQWGPQLRHNEPMFIGHRFEYPFMPGQPGHEATGTVAALGEGVTELATGDRVSAWRDAGHRVPGCYAQYAARKVEHLIRVPAHLPPEATAPVELAMCVGATFLLLRQMEAVAGKRFAGAGLGPAGLIAVPVARAGGGREGVGCELS